MNPLHHTPHPSVATAADRTTATGRTAARTRRRNARPGIALVAALIWSALAGTASHAATTPAEQLAGYVAKAGAPASAQRGQQFFNTSHGREWQCSSCHGAVPLPAGKHASTGKAIGPLAPAANAERFTDAAKTEKWFRRNCNDVLGRECSAGEKADVMAWLIGLK